MELELKLKYSELEIEEILRKMGYDIELHKLPECPTSDICVHREYKLALKGRNPISIDYEYTLVFRRFLEQKLKEFTSKIGNDYLYE